MLNRRYLRVKVFQTLYSYFSSDSAELVKMEKEMLKSIDKIYDLYLYMFLLLSEVATAGRRKIEQDKSKRLPTEEDLNPNLRFVENRVILQLEENIIFQRLIDTKKISWHGEEENIRKLFRQIREDEEYAAYMNSPKNGFEEDKQFVIRIFKKHIAEFELLHAFLEEKSIYWMDDLPLVCINLVKNLQSFREKDTQHDDVLFKLWKDREDDLAFVKKLLRKTASNNKEYAQLIADKTKNWEVDRIAVLDVILMKMAVTEFEHFDSIPVKVSLNEYIELSKNYSTPKSKVFINGILDKLVIDLKSQKRIRKTGRGLIE